MFKKGKIYVNYIHNSFGRRTDRAYQLYHVSGEVFLENNKTFVKITSYYKKTSIWLCFFEVILSLLLFPIIILLNIVEGFFSIPAFIIAFIVLLCSSIDTIRSAFAIKKRKTELVTLMENEIKKRVRNLERRDD